MRNEHVAKTSVIIKAKPPLVWDALVNPEKIKQYMLGATVKSEWQVGSGIVWSGEWKGKAFRDTGMVLRVEPEKLLEYTHFSPMEGKPDIPENYHTVTIELADEGYATLVALSQDNNASDKEKAASEENWKTMLAGLRELLEKKPEALHTV
jgi:uncharacterized protein YndB with AHSA1/START domain